MKWVVMFLMLPGLAQAQTAAAQLPRDLSFRAMVGNADWVVKAVLIGLLFASVLSWTVAIGKAVELFLAERRVLRGVRILQAATALHGVTVEGPCQAMVIAAQREAGMPGAGALQRADWQLQRILARGARVAGRGTGWLATIGATAPFVGLFGTVWGIMNSFIGISRAQTTNLAVVAPGIAEALLTTAIGLFAAIPAVVLYNLFARLIATHRAHLADAAAEVMRLLSRTLEV